MILSIRATSGSGKSTLVKRIMALYAACEPEFVEGRKQPISYLCRDPDAPRSLVVLGHYETPCGGCDTLDGFDQIFELVRLATDDGCDVLFEGVLLYCEVPRTCLMVDDGFPFEIIALNTPVDECVASVNLRRWERGDPEPVNAKNTEGKHRGTITTMARLQERGVPVTWANRQEAYELIIDRLQLNPDYKFL